MAEVRGFRWSGGSGGIDVERAIVNGDGAALGRAQCFPWNLADADVNSFERRVVDPVGPDDGRPAKIRSRFTQRVDKLRGDDEVPGACDIDAMCERRARPGWC